MSECERHVVTVFLRYRKKYLLLQRSHLVGTYRGRWAAVSGYLETDEQPLERAKREVLEETGLHVSRLIPGAEIVVRDSDTTWIVHPFIADVNTPKVRLDYEHIGYRWVRFEDIKKFDTVPKLLEALLSVLRPNIAPQTL